jgi:lipid-binding SYLF domain-containing protein
MRRVQVSVLIVLLLGTKALAGDKEQERLANCATMLEEILNIPDAIPQELLDKAECVMVVPSVKKFAIGLGGSYGRGTMVCRTGTNFMGPWGPPAMYRLEGGNIGFQLGGQATDFVFLVMNPKGADSLLRSKVKLGADAAAVAGPKGRTALAATDAYMRAEILSYSRSRGLFAGVSLEGSTLRQDNKANEKIYGRKIAAREIVREGRVAVPAAGRSLVRLLQKASLTNQSQ